MRTVRDVFYRIRSWLINVYLPIIHKNIKLGRGLRITNSVINCRGGELSIGEGFFMNRNGSINCRYKISIGEYCLIGENVHIYDHNHVFIDKKKPLANQGFKKKAVKIGDHVWIGTSVTILAGVEIGDNVVIGANCLIYKDIPSNTIVKNKTEYIYDINKDE